MKNKIIIFGTGSVAEVLVGEINDSVDVIAFVNSNEQIRKFHGYKVIRPIDITNYVYDYVLVASGYFLEIERQLLELGIAKERIVGFIYDDAQSYQEISEAIGIFLNQRYNRNVLRTMLKTNKLFPNLYAGVFWKNSCFHEVEKDFVREQTMALMGQEIERKNVEGAVAELGVFRGDFTVIINKALQDRKLYLFDTFSGFGETDVMEDDTIANKENELLKFRNTSEELVMSRLNAQPNQCVIKKGWFPNTFDLYDEKFCFVSIDMNMYEPVMKALELFYPRVSEGGYIMICTYNAPFYDGTRKAVIDYCDKFKINFLPVPDLFGSVIICK